MKRIFNGSGGRKAALILSLCLIFALAVGTTLALLKANTAPVTNTFKAATSEIKIEEKTDGGISRRFTSRTKEPPRPTSASSWCATG